MIDEITKQLKSLINGKLIYLSQYGSHLYGLNTENSDLDFRGVYIPALDDVILKKDKDEINTELEVKTIERRRKLIDHTFEEGDYEWTDVKKKVDVKIFSLQKFIQLCSKADTNALDLLFSVGLGINGEIGVQPEQETYADPYGWHIMWKLLYNRNKLINTDRLESPISYAFKQAEKYSIKGTRYKIMQDILVIINRILYNDYDMPIYENKNLQIKDCIKEFEGFFDNKHIKIDELDNKGKLEKYLYICGVQHQFNLPIATLADRIEEKINKEYTSQRTINAKDGNDWKALSHAIRVLLEIKELLDTSNIQFPLKNKKFLLDIKLGKVEREFIDNFFNQELSNILERVQKNELNWKYDEEFWNDFILKEVKRCDMMN